MADDIKVNLRDRVARPRGAEPLKRELQDRGSVLQLLKVKRQ
jgi:hypothetical protein